MLKAYMGYSPGYAFLEIGSDQKNGWMININLDLCQIKIGVRFQLRFNLEINLGFLNISVWVNDKSLKEIDDFFTLPDNKFE